MEEVTVDIKIRVKITLDGCVPLVDVINELDYLIKDSTGHAVINDTEITDFEED